jgi:hypothetical protein
MRMKVGIVDAALHADRREIRNGTINVGLASGAGEQVMQVFPPSNGRRMPWYYTDNGHNGHNGRSVTRSCASLGWILMARRASLCHYLHNANF